MNNVVLKFGGTSVSSRKHWENIAAIVQARLAEGEKPLLVCSALSQASNQLKGILTHAISGQYHDMLLALTDRYKALALELEVNPTLIDDDVIQLTQALEDIASSKKSHPHTQAHVMAFGEIMLTRLATEFLKNSGVQASWCDARDFLKHDESASHNEGTHYLSARCQTDYDDAFATYLKNNTVTITQGFIASNAKGETVLLGRGGSDVSAAYFAAKLNATRCEIWTDVPGVYTANPKIISSARHLKKLSYEEAQEIASMGAKVLHPNTIGPCRRANIPLHINYTSEPTREGTQISFDADDSGVQIKSILTKHGLTLITIETVHMWQQVGFLADVFSCFKKQGLSIDLVSTSEANVTVSLDESVAETASDAIARVIDDLNQFATAKIIGPCASISLVGRNIREILHQLGGAFEIFESQKIYLLSQAANDLNLTFVVDEAQSLRLAKSLHTLLIDQNPKSHYLSQSWQEEFGQFIPREIPWWEKRREELLALGKKSSPAYIYNQETVNARADQLLNADSIDSIYYAMKANSNTDILKTIYAKGLNFECVSLEEINLILSLFPEIDRHRILFTPNFAASNEYQKALALEVNVTVDNLYPLEQWPEIFASHSILVRVDPGHGAGHHKFVITGGDASKFGIPISRMDKVEELSKKHNITITGLHIHSGSGILTPDNWRRSAKTLTALLKKFTDVSVLNLGGGLGVVERPGQSPLDIKGFNESLKPIKKAHPALKLWLEPGRFLVAEAGVLIAKVTQLKTKGDTQFIGIDAGMNSLIRPALYGAYHEIVNLTRLDQPKKIIANIVGPICESGDTLGTARLLPETKEDDIILIATAGAYGYVMGSHYNQRAPAEEISFVSQIKNQTNKNAKAATSTSK